MSETQTIFSFLSTAAAFFVHFLGLQPKSKSLSGLRTKQELFLTDNNNSNPMIGAIIGDIAGSRFEFDNYRNTDFEIRNLKLTFTLRFPEL